MQDFTKLDEKFRLTPWSMPEHAAHVASRYGSLFVNKDAAELYVQGYEKAEKEHDLAYKAQKERALAAPVVEGAEASYPEEVKIDWDPRGLFSGKKELKEEPKEEKKQEERNLKVKKSK